MVILGISPYTFLNIGFNLAISHSSGKVDNFIDKFIIFLKGRLLSYIIFFVKKLFRES